MEFFFVLALFFYVAGHRVKEVRPEATVPRYFRKLIKPPRYIYLICASPKSNKHPIGVMLAAGLAAQILGIGCAFYALVFFINPSAIDSLGMVKVVIQVVSLVLIVIASYGIPFWFVQKYPYQE